jgi:hypothetical protein
MFSRLFTTSTALPTTLASTLKLHLKEHPKFAKEIICRIDKVVCDKEQKLDHYLDIAIYLSTQASL